jgi:prevent-host-death family protein
VARRNHVWAVAKAKAQLSAVIDRALAEGPQTITRSGRTEVVVVSADEWKRKTQRTGSLTDFLARSPLRGAGVRIRRQKANAREIEI